MAILMFDAENVEFKFPRLRRHPKATHFIMVITGWPQTWKTWKTWKTQGI